MTTPQRKAKIYSKKLPGDFFAQRNQQTNRFQMQTQAIPRRISNIERLANTREVKVRTGRLAEEDEAIDLLRGVIATSREMRKMIRRHSLEMKKENNNMR